MRLGAALTLLMLVPSGAAAQWAELDVPAPPPDDASLVDAGREIYDTHCWYCHGDEGDGAGPVSEYLWPRPRDFRIASFKLRTTPSGELPTDEDLFRTVTLGAPGSAMPAWGSVLTVRERWQVIAYLKTFGEGVFEDEAFDPYDLVIAIGRPPRGRRESLIDAGRAVYERSDCWECHGEAGRGDGGKAEGLTDDWGLPIRTADLQLGWKFRGGDTPRDVYVRLTTGLDGTPMPSYAQTLTDAERWQLAYYVASLAAPVTAEGAGPVVIRATRSEGPVPIDPSDRAWAEATTTWIPLTGQATYPPRWQVASVTDLFVQALYDADEIAFRVGWNDAVADSLERNPGQADTEGWDPDPGYPRLFPAGERRRGRYRDALEILFPATVENPILPHFVYGDARRPVDLWRWTAGGAAAAVTPVDELRAVGAEAPPARRHRYRTGATARASWVDGRWTVVVRRALDDDAPFRPGALVPVAFHVRDGSNGETGLRMSLSSWYFVHLQEPGGAPQALLVLLAVLATAGLEYAAVRIVRRLAREGRLRPFGVGP